MSPANADSAAMCRDDRTGYPYIAYISGTGNGTELCLSYWDEVQTRWSAVTVDSQVGDINLLWRQVSCAFDASTSTLGIAYLRMVKIPDYNLMSTIALKLYVRLLEIVADLTRTSVSLAGSNPPYNALPWTFKQISHPPGKLGDGCAARCPSVRTVTLER